MTSLCFSHDIRPWEIWRWCKQRPYYYPIWVRLWAKQKVVSKQSNVNQSLQLENKSKIFYALNVQKRHNKIVEIHACTCAIIDFSSSRHKFISLAEMSSFVLYLILLWKDSDAGYFLSSWRSTIFLLLFKSNNYISLPFCTLYFSKKIIFRKISSHESWKVYVDFLIELPLQDVCNCDLMSFYIIFL